jgi:hypothetical protein
MKHAWRATVLGVMVSAGTGCLAEAEEPTTAVASQPLASSCDYITCGRNTKDVGNHFIDHVFFDGTVNERGQQFVSWKTAGGAAITPQLTARSLRGYIDGQWRTGSALVGSTITVKNAGGQLLRLRFMEAKVSALPNGVSVWTYRISKQRLAPLWTPLCSLFDHTDDPIARFALVGTQELVHAEGKQVTPHAPSAGKLTIGCANSATGKMLSLGALKTTAASGEVPTVAEMTATLRALTLSPIGETSYTKSGVGIMFNVIRTGVNNHGESLSGGVEGIWDKDGAICFDRLRINDPQLSWALWSQTQVPPCSEVDLSAYEYLVTTHRYFGVYPEYPPPPPPPLPIGGFVQP